MKEYNMNLVEALLHIAQAKAYLHNADALFSDSDFDSDRGGGFEHYSIGQIIDSLLHSIVNNMTTEKKDVEG